MSNEPGFLQLVFEHANQSPGLMVVCLGAVAGTPYYRGNVEERRAVQHITAVSLAAVLLELREDTVRIPDQFGKQRPGFGDDLFCVAIALGDAVQVLNESFEGVHE